MIDLRDTLLQIKLELQKLKLLPGEIEVAQFADFYFSNIKMREFEGVISESVVCGFDQDPEMAVLKSFSEYIETLSFREGARKNLEACLTERSDGLAAFPKQIAEHKLKARQNALCEAIERFVWAHWWDDPRVGFDLGEVHFRSSQTPEGKLLRELSGIVEIDSVVSVSPHFSSSIDTKVMIWIAFLKSGGVISGGACGQEGGLVKVRAISELIRHGLAAQEFKSNSIEPISFYERRLCYFLKLEGEEAVRRRLMQTGSMSVALPAIRVDQEIPSVVPDSFYVHRCLFEDQPQFIGGALERFCL